MIRRQYQFIQSIKAVSDLLLVTVCWPLAYFLRFHVDFVNSLIPVTKGVPGFIEYLPLLVLIFMTWLVVFITIGLYRPSASPSLSREVFRVVRANTTALLTFMAASIMVAEVKPSGATIMIFALLTTVSLTVSRILFRRIIIGINRRPENRVQALVAGTGELGRRLANKISNHRELGLTIAGFLTDNKEEIGSTIDGLEVLGHIQDINQVVADGRINQVFIALPLSAHQRIGEVLENLAEEMVDVKIVPDLYQFVTLRGGVEDFDGLPIIHLKETSLYGWRIVAKRMFDVAFSSLALGLGSPLYLALAIGVKLTSPGPVIYRQRRMGLDGRTFDVLKFRSMRVDAEKETGAKWAVKDDPRRTSFGTFIRKTNLDEIPQFWNILVGHMSVVGPRPERPVFIEQFRQQVPRYMLRHRVKAGLTGWAQVHGWRGNTDLAKRIEHDLYYIQHWSFGLDLRIIWKTIYGDLVNTNAY